MKLLTNRQFQGILEKAIKPFKEKIEELSTKINNKEFKYLDDRDKALKELNKQHIQVAPRICTCN